jgi:hypothetical protein
VKLYFFIVCFLCFTTFFSTATAQKFNVSDLEFDTFYVMIQITQRDNAGNLITYLEYDSPYYLNLELTDALLDGIATENDPIFSINGYTIQTVSRITPLSTDASGLLSTVQYFLNDSLGRQHIIVQFTHDGMRLNSDEQIEVIWTFVRFV